MARPRRQAPVYPLLVAAAYWLGGIGTPYALLILELGQALLGGLLVAGVLALARSVAPGRPRLAILAGLIAALHPSLVYAATHVQVAALAATLLTAALAVAFRAGRTGHDRDALSAGLLLGLLALTDPILVLVAPGLAWAVVLGQGVRRAARPITVTALASALVVAPWIVRNTRVYGEFVAIKSTFGYAFWQGNCSVSQGTDKVVRPSVEQTLARAQGQSARDLSGWNASLWAARHAAGYLDDIALTADDYRELARLSEPERSRRLFHRALRDLRADPSRYPRLCLRRLRYFVFFDETNPKTRNILYRASHLVLTLLALAGLLRTTAHGPQTPRTHDSDRSPDRRVPLPDHRLGSVPYSDRAAPGTLGSVGLDSPAGTTPTSTAAAHHVERVGIDPGLAVKAAGIVRRFVVTQVVPRRQDASRRSPLPSRRYPR